MHSQTVIQSAAILTGGNRQQQVSVGGLEAERASGRVDRVRTTSNDENVDHKHYPTNHNLRYYVESDTKLCVRGGDTLLIDKE